MQNVKQKIRVGIMGFGKIGRQLYHLAAACDDIEVVAICDIGDPEILLYLLNSEAKGSPDYELHNNYLINGSFKTRMLQASSPDLVPWDVFGVDFVIEATGRYYAREHMEQHLKSGAGRVLLAALPDDHIDRLIIPGVNCAQASVTDKMISAGSATTNALALLLKIIDEKLAIKYASMTSVHAYTSDQSLQDYAGKYFRRSRSAPENIIPNSTQACQWVESILPKFTDCLSGYALNVPVQKGSMLDLSLVFENDDVTADDVNNTVVSALPNYQGLLDIAEDPIVSCDVIGNSCSVLYDVPGTIKAGKRMVKAIAWYESLGQAQRILDVARMYASMDQQEVAA
ncbi:MAG: glyceraldehyde 3-phosphate dehydrogenase NAD-binding domain-containing protein [Pseudomonadales bacterium]